MPTELSSPGWWLFWALPLTIPFAEILLTVYLSRRQVRWRLRWVIGSYLILIVAALLFGMVVRDEFGFGFIPLMLSTASWEALPASMREAYPLAILRGVNFPFDVLLGTAFYCSFFVLIDRLSYPKHAATLSGRHAT